MFNATVNELCVSALRKVGAVGEDETPSQYMMDNARLMLNSIIKEAQVDGMPLWAMEDVEIPCANFAGNKYIFTNENSAPLKVVQGVIRDRNGNIDIPMVMLTHYDYNRLPNKQNEGMPIQFFHNIELRKGELYVWPSPDAYSRTNRSVVITVQRPFNDVGVANSQVDFPSYWNRALIYQLAWSLAPEYGVPINDRQILAKEADVMWTRAQSFGTEEGSLFMTMDTQFSGR